MTGRGKRLGDLANSNQKDGGLLPFTEDDEHVDLSVLIKNINDIDLLNSNNATLLKSIEKIFKKLCYYGKAINEVLAALHSKALSDVTFGEKVVIALEQVSDFEVENVIVRNELLTFIQNDFKFKDETFKLSKEKFLNSIMLLGGVYQRIRVCGVPILVLGIALFEYFDMLLKGSDDELRVLATQIFINGGEFKSSDSKDLCKKYELLEKNLRNTLVSEDLSKVSRCWILLTLDFMSNKSKPLTGEVKEFYIENLGDDYKKFESLAKVLNKDKASSFSSPESVKSQSDGFTRNRRSDTSQRKKDDKVNLPERFSDLSVTKSEGEKFRKIKEKQPSGGRNEKKGFWKQQAGEKPPGGNKNFSGSGHDDRFDKDENFYGVQLPRRPKPENQKNSEEDKSNKKGFERNPKSPTKFE